MVDLGMAFVDNWVVGKEEVCYWFHAYLQKRSSKLTNDKFYFGMPSSTKTF